MGLILAQIGGCRSVVEVEIDDCGFDWAQIGGAWPCVFRLQPWVSAMGL